MIDIDLPKLLYEPGEAVTGTVLYTTKNKVKELKSVKIKLKGYEVVFVTDTKKKWITQQTVDLFPSNTVEGQGFDKLSPNTTYRWPFRFNIPDTAPPSLNDPNGGAAICYRMKVTVDPKWGLKKFARQIIRVDKLDTLDLRPPKVFEASKSYSTSNNGVNDEISMRAVSDKRSTHSCDTVKVEVNVLNNSNKTTSSIKAYLMRSTKYGKSRKIVPVMVRKFSVKIPAKGRWSGDFKIRIPRFTMMPTVMNASLIEVQYFISVRIHVSLITKDVVVDLPIQVTMRTKDSPLNQQFLTSAIGVTSNKERDKIGSPMQRKFKEISRDMMNWMGSADATDAQDESQVEVGEEWVSLIDKTNGDDKTPCLIPQTLFHLPSAAAGGVVVFQEPQDEAARLRDFDLFTELRANLVDYRSDFANPFFGGTDVAMATDVQRWYHSLWKSIYDIQVEYKTKRYDLFKLRELVEKTKTFLENYKGFADSHEFPEVPDFQKEVLTLGVGIIDHMLELLEGLYSQWEQSKVSEVSSTLQQQLNESVRMLQTEASLAQ